MRLKSVHIKNFRCFESLEIPLAQTINVIIGNNGAGKSTVLDAIAMGLHPLADCLTTRKQEISSILAKDIYRDQLGKTASFAKITLASIDDLVWSDERRRDTLIDDTQALRRMIYGSDANVLVKHFRPFNAAVSADELAPSILPVFAYYRTGRNVVKMPGIRKDPNAHFPRLSAMNGALNASADFQSVVTWFNAKENQELRAQRERQDLKYILPDLECVRQAVLRLIKPAKGIFFSSDTPPKLTLRWSANGKTADRLVSQLSDGYRNMLALVMDFSRRLAQANPQLEAPLEAEAILLIDEIDLHLHPAWQQTILTALKRAFPQTQIITTTHSPQVISTVRPENIRVLEIDGTCSVPHEHTYGAESSRVLAEIFCVHPRPDLLKKEIDEYLSLIESGQGDSARASELRRQLDEALGETDPLLISADIRKRLISARAS